MAFPIIPMCFFVYKEFFIQIVVFFSNVSTTTIPLKSPFGLEAVALRQDGGVIQHVVERTLVPDQIQCGRLKIESAVHGFHVDHRFGGGHLVDLSGVGRNEFERERSVGSDVIRVREDDLLCIRGLFDEWSVGMTLCRSNIS